MAMGNKNKDRKAQQEGREARALANLMLQPTKKQGGHDGIMKGGSTWQILLPWSLSLPYHNVMAMGKNDNQNNRNKAQ